jgi:hypothetical protein
MDDFKHVRYTDKDVAANLLQAGKCSFLSYVKFATDEISFPEFIVESEAFIQENEENKERDRKIKQEFERARNMSSREFAEKYIKIKTPDGPKSFTKEQLDEMEFLFTLQPGDQLLLIRGRSSTKIGVLSREIKPDENE